MAYKSKFTGRQIDNYLDNIGNKQDKLVSGTNIKTINGTSILGSGDITISGGGSSSGNGAYAEVNHGTLDTTFALTPNTFHVWDEVSDLTLTLGSETSGVANEYLFQFTSGATATSLTLPDDIKWANDSAPTIAENMIYQVSILKGLASVLEFSNKAGTITFFVTKGLDTYEFTCIKGMTWEEFINSEYNNGTFAIYTQYNNQIRWSAAFQYGVVGATPAGVIEEGVTYQGKYGD